MRFPSPPPLQIWAAFPVKDKEGLTLEGLTQLYEEVSAS